MLRYYLVYSKKQKGCSFQSFDLIFMFLSNLITYSLYYVEYIEEVLIKGYYAYHLLLYSILKIFL